MPNKFGRGAEVYDALRARTLSLPHDAGGNFGADAGSLGLGNKIMLWDSGGLDLRLYDATQAGLISALADSDDGDTVWLPSRTISLATGVTVPEGVTLSGAGLGASPLLNAAGFSGTVVTLSSRARCIGFAIDFISNGATAIGIDGRFPGSWIESMRVRVKGATTENIAIYSGAGSLTREVWFMDCVSLNFQAPTRLVWSNNFFTADSTVWTAAGVPASLVNGPGGTIHGFDIALDGSIAYLLSYDTTPRIWKTANPRVASPSWTNILSGGDLITGQIIDGIGQIWAHTGNLYTLVRTSSGGRFHGRYDGTSWTWTSTSISPNDARNEAVFPGHYTKHFSPNNTLYSIAGAASHTWADGTTFTPRERNSWENAVGGPRYLPIELPGDPGNSCRIRNAVSGSDVITGLNDNPRNAWIRGAWNGAGVCVTVQDAAATGGDLWISTDGVSFTNTFNWLKGIAEPGNLSDMQLLAWIAYTTAEDAEMIRGSTNGGTSWTNKTGNFWTAVHTETTEFKLGHMKIAIY